MTDVRELLSNLRKNLPPLRYTAQQNKEIVLESNPNSIVKKLYNHRKHDSNEESKPSKENFKWLKIKEQMIIDMENKRNEEWQKQNMSKMQDEENEDDECFNEVIEDEDNISDNDENGEPCEDTTECVDDNGNNSDDECFIKRKNIKCVQIDEGDESDVNEVSESENIDSDQLINEDYLLSNTDVIDRDFEFEENDFSEKDDKFFISQNLPLTPICSPPKKTNEETNSYLEIEAENGPNYDSQMLLDLCSGNFDETNNIEINKATDNTELNGDVSSEEETDEEEPHVINKKNIKKLTRQFIEDEAELSGSEDDVSSDEDELEDDEFEQDAILEDLPSDDELKGQVEKIYNKDILDEDKRQLMILKEYFFDDGDLHDESGNRKRKFKWSMGNEMDDFVNVLSDSENEEEYESNNSDNDEENKIVRLKKEINDDNELNTNIQEIVGVENKKQNIGLSFEKKLKTKFIKPVGKKNMSISSFVIRDERLKGILNKERSNVNETSVKKLKTQDSLSIFDVLNC